MVYSKKWLAFGLLMIVLSLLFSAMLNASGHQIELTNEIPPREEMETPATTAQEVFLEEVKRYEKTHGKLTTAQQEKVDKMYEVMITPMPTISTEGEFHLKQWGKLIEAAPWEKEMPKFVLTKEKMIHGFNTHLERSMNLPTTSDFQKVILQALQFQMNKYLADNNATDVKVERER